MKVGSWPGLSARTWAEWGIKGVFKIIWEMIRKGSNVGSKVSNHRIRPVFEASKDREGKRNRKQNRNKIIIGVISFFKIKIL